MTVTIVSTIQYTTRVLAMVDIENSDGKYRTYFYRSSGTNVDGKGKWFPFSCLAGQGATERTHMHSGWISKNLFLANEKFMKKIHTRIRNEREHSDPEARLNAFHDKALTFNVKEVSDELHKQYEENPNPPIADFQWPVDPEDIGFINTWIVKGVRVVYPDLSKEDTTPKADLVMTEEEEAILRSLFV